MKKNIKNQRSRKSIRLKGYDYSSQGLYFITICCQGQSKMFGHIENKKMHLNPAGCMVEKWYVELERKYPDKKCREMVVMPNHFHCILENAPNIGDSDAHAKTDAHATDDHVGTSLRGRPDDSVKTNQQYNATIGDAVGWFKTMTTNEYIRGVKTLGWKRFDKRLWQRNYYEHIIAMNKRIDVLRDTLPIIQKKGRQINFINPKNKTKLLLQYLKQK